LLLRQDDDYPHVGKLLRQREAYEPYLNLGCSMGLDRVGFNHGIGIGFSRMGFVGKVVSKWGVLNLVGLFLQVGDTPLVVRNLPRTIAIVCGKRYKKIALDVSSLKNKKGW